MDNIRLKNQKYRRIWNNKIEAFDHFFVEKNGMGKSSLMRLLPLIKQSVAV